MPERSTILVVDDEAAILEVMRLNLESQGYRVETALVAEEGLRLLAEKIIDAVLVDYKMPGMNGIEFIEKVKARCSHLPVIMVTAFGSIEMAVEAMKKGAFNYLTKPLNYEEMFLLLKQAVEKKRLVENVQELQKVVKNKYRFDSIITNSKKMLDLLEVVDNVAGTDATALIRGETGTGKELIARAIHYNSVRAGKPFVKINCTALPDSLLETELFGHVRGAFTGANRDRKGRFEVADGGTLLLDEIGDISQNMQAKMLRVLQEMEFERLGSNETIRVDVRIIASTHLDMEKAIREGRFREDLYFRLNVVPILIPPLRERKDDIYLLANTFLERFNKKHKKNIRVIPSDLLTRFLQYDWPGNVRELENSIERGVVLSRHDALDVKYFQNFQAEPLEKKKAEKDLLIELEEKYAGLPNTLALVARELGINVSTLYRKRKKYGII